MRRFHADTGADRAGRRHARYPRHRLRTSIGRETQDGVDMSTGPQPLDPGIRRRIADSFLPDRWLYWYARSKLGSDPLYGGVAEALRDTRAPLLDIGCGIGLLVHALRACGVDLEYTGVDNDEGKVEQGRLAIARTQLPHARLMAVDATAGLPDHRGSVTLLDVLQFLPPEAQSPLLADVAARVSQEGRLVIRTGLTDGNWRSHVTRGVDVLSRWLRWMNAGPTRYPGRDALAAELSSHGLTATFTPLWGRTPFNNWLVVASRQSSGSGTTVR